MAEGYVKRPRDPDDDYGPPAKRDSTNKMVEDFLESLDSAVRIKLRSMFDDGLLMYSDLDERNISELSKFDASVALQILEHYCSGDLSQVRNRRAYLAGAIKRRLQHARETDLPSEDGLPLLDRDVQRKFDQLKQLNPKVGELDQRSMGALATIPPVRALAALNRFGAMDFSAVRNPSALFMSIVRGVMEQHDIPGVHGRGPGGYRDAPYDPYQDHYEHGPPPPPPPPPPRRAPPAGQIAGVGSLPLGTTLVPGPNGSLVVQAPAALTGGLAGLSAGLQQAIAGISGAAAPGLVVAAAPGASAVPQLMYVASSAAQGAVGLPQMLAAPAGGVMSGQQLLGALQQQQMQQQQQQQQQQQVPAAVAAAAVSPDVPADWATGRKNHGVEQGQLGVRVAEFHELSPFAVFVHPSSALKLQSLWDSGNELVSMLDDKVWQVLAELPAPEALAAIQESADALDNPDSNIRNINAFFMSVVRRVMPQQYGSHQRSGPPSSGGRGDFASHRGSYGGRGGGGGSRGGSGDWGGTSGDPGGKPHWSREPAIHLLPPEQRLKAEALCRAHAPLLREEHFDEGVIDGLKRLSHADGMAVLDELGTNSMAGVRNVPAYIMGIAKRYCSGQRSAAGQGQAAAAGHVPTVW